MKFVLATHNPGKLKEMADILSGLGVEVVSPADVGISVDVEETGTTFAENAMLKAKAICAASGLPAIADDSGLCVDALNGGPGVYSARYGGEELDDRGRYTLLLQNMRGQTTRAAHFACAIACAFPGGDELTAEGGAGSNCGADRPYSHEQSLAVSPGAARFLRLQSNQIHGGVLRSGYEPGRSAADTGVERLF